MSIPSNIPEKVKMFLLLEENFEHCWTKVTLFSEFNLAYQKLCQAKDAEINEIMEEGKDYYQVADSDFPDMVGYRLSVIEQEVEDVYTS